MAKDPKPSDKKEPKKGKLGLSKEKAKKIPSKDLDKASGGAKNAGGSGIAGCRATQGFKCNL